MAKREFTGVFIPACVWESKALTPAEKMMLGEIIALSESRGYCSAGRQHFADWLNCTLPNISYMYKKLEKMGYLSIEREPGKSTKIIVNKSLFYTSKSDLPVNGIYGGSKRDLRVPVNGIYGGSKRDLPEIQYKENTIINSKNNKDESEKNAFFGEAEKEKNELSLVGQKKEKSPPNSARPPKKKAERDWSDVLAFLPENMKAFIDCTDGRVAWFDYLQHRKEIGAKPFGSAKSEAIAIRMLYKISNGHTANIQPIIDQSRANGWVGLFEIKNISQRIQNKNYREQQYELAQRVIADRDRLGFD